MVVCSLSYTDISINYLGWWYKDYGDNYTSNGRLGSVSMGPDQG